MGNAALKSCFRGRSKVRVVLLSGEVVEFKGRVTASTVMRQYPHHHVLHCSMAGKQHLGRRRRISVLKPEQALKGNQNYVIMPVQSVGTGRSFLDSWAFFSLNICNAKQKASGRKMNRQKKGWWIHRVFEKIFTSKSVAKANDEASRPLLSIEEPSHQPSRSAEQPDDWSPSLECIPESPSRSPRRTVDRTCSETLQNCL